MSQFLGSLKAVTPQATFTSEPWAIAVATFRPVILGIEGTINTAQLNGATIDTNSGNKSAGTQRVVLATDQPALTNALKVDGSAVTQPVSGTFWQATQPVSGTVSITANSAVNVAQVAGGNTSNAGQTGAMQVGGAVATNNNVSSATNPLLIAGSDYGGTPKVQSLKVDSSGNGQVAVTNTPAVSQSGTWTAVPNAATSGGTTPFHALSAASNNATSVKGSAGQLYSLCISNAISTARFFKLYDKATAPSPASDTVKRTVQIPGNTTVIQVFPLGLAFSTGIAFAAVANISDTDNTSIAASDLSIDVDYK
jgi:hypothetical protein